MGASPFVKLAIFGGLAFAAVAVAIIGGMVINVLNDGEDHKEAMMRSPPPAPAPASRMRAMAENQEIYGRGNVHFDLTKNEKAFFQTLAQRKVATGKHAMR
jgi:hypothetical protein